MITDQKLQKRTEVLAKMLARGRTDIIYFANEILGIKLHEGQKKWLIETMKPHRKRNILVPANKWAKTVVTVVKEIYKCFYKDGISGTAEQIKAQYYPVLHASPHSMQVQAGLEYIRQILTGNFTWKEDGKTLSNQCLISDFFISVTRNPLKAKFANNSCVIGASTGEDKGASLAGSDFAYIGYDEAPQSRHLKEELPARLLSRLIKFGGDIDIIGTPEDLNPITQTYYRKIVKMGLAEEKGWFTMTGKLDDNTFLSEEKRLIMKKELMETDPEKYRQVVFGEFIDTGGKMFSSGEILQMWTEEIPTPAKDTPFDADPMGIYLISVDWGFSDRGDPTVMFVFDISTKPYKIVYCFAYQGGDPSNMLSKLRQLRGHFNNAIVVHDKSSMGGVIVDKQLKDIHPKSYSYQKVKGEMLYSLKDSMTAKRRTKFKDNNLVDMNLNFGLIRSFYIPKLEEELSNYSLDDKNLEQDYVMALAMGIHHLERKNKLGKPYTATGYIRSSY